MGHYWLIGQPSRLASKHIIMTVHCRSIHSLEVAINKKKCLYAKLYKVAVRGNSFSSKIVMKFL